jgi:hypothetical protein
MAFVRLPLRGYGLHRPDLRGSAAQDSAGSVPIRVGRKLLRVQGGQNVTLLAVMPYCGRSPNVGRLEAGPKMKVRPHLWPSMVGRASVSVVSLCDVESPHFVLQGCALQPETFRRRSCTGDSSRCRFQRLNDRLALRLLERRYGSGISDG